MDLEQMTHDQLDAHAAEHGIEPYPTGGIKADKVAAIAAADLPATCTAIANASLAGWPIGEVRQVAVTDRLLRRAANGLVTVLADPNVARPALSGFVDLDVPAVAADLDDPEPDDAGEDAPGSSETPAMVSSQGSDDYRAAQGD